MSEPSSVIVNYAVKFYDLLYEQSSVRKLTENDPKIPYYGPGQEVRIWSGSLQKVFKETGASNTYYSRIRRILIKYDCITYLQRGTKSYDSALILNHPPPVEKITPEDLTRRQGDATLTAVAERLDSLETQVTGLKNWKDGMGGLDIAKALLNIETRLQQLEGKPKAGVKANAKNKV